jgi:hypothetical protein
MHTTIWSEIVGAGPNLSSYTLLQSLSVIHLTRRCTSWLDVSVVICLSQRLRATPPQLQFKSHQLHTLSATSPTSTLVISINKVNASLFLMCWWLQTRWTLPFGQDSMNPNQTNSRTLSFTLLINCECLVFFGVGCGRSISKLIEISLMQTL